MRQVAKNTAGPVHVFVSAFTSDDAGAIHIFYLDTDSGQLTQIQRFTDIQNPFFIALSANKQFLYATHAPGDFFGENNNEVAAYRISDDGGELELLNRRSTLGSGTCYIDLDRDGRIVLLANYASGSVTSYAVDKDGSLLEASSVIQHKGKSVNTDRQSGPHAHCIVSSPDSRFAFAADLGADRIQSYRLDSKSTQILPNNPSGADTVPGSGPRHLLFHPSGKSVYVNNELGNSITVFDYETDIGRLSERQTISTLPNNFTGESFTADLKIAPDGQFLYCSNRGHDSIASYCVRDDGGLEFLAIESSCGESPQNLAITPCGKWLICANMIGACVAVFRIDSVTGHLELTGRPVEMPAPSCIAIRC